MEEKNKVIEFIISHRVVYYLIQFTWGLLMNIVGFAVFLFCLVVGRKPKMFVNCPYANIGAYWGGASMGTFFITDEADSLSVKKHESGHAVQNLFFGPLMPFLVCIPSAIRYLYRELKYNRKGLTPPTDYDSIWFEGQATRLGNLYYREK